MKLKQISSFGRLLALLLSVLLILSACKNAPTPSSHLDDILEATFGGGSSSLLGDKKSACVEILYRPTEDLSLEGLGDVSLKIYSDKTSSGALQLRAELYEQLLDLDAYSTEDVLILVSSLLGDSAYGISGDGLMSLLENIYSAYDAPTIDASTMQPAVDAEGLATKDDASSFATFGELSGIDGSINYEEAKDIVFGDGSLTFGENDIVFEGNDLTFGGESSILNGEMSAIGSASSLLTTILSALSSEENLETLSTLVERYLDVLKSSLNKDLETSVKHDDKGTTVSFTFNNDCAKKLIKNLFKEMQDDDELREFLAQLVGSISPDMTELLMQQYDAFLNNEAALLEIFEELDNSPFNVTVSISADKNSVMNAAKLVLDIIDEGERTRFTLLFDASTESKTELSFQQEIYDDAAKIFQPVLGGGICYEVKENTAERYDASLRVFYTAEGSGMDLTVLQVSYDKVNGDYQLCVPLSKLPLGIAQDLVLSGNYQSSDAETSLTVTQITAPEIGTLTTDLTVKITYNVELPKVPAEYRDIAQMTEEDLSALMEAMMEHPLVQLLMTALPSDPLPPSSAPENEENSSSASRPNDKEEVPEETVQTTAGGDDEVDLPVVTQTVYTGSFMNDDATMTVSEDRAVFDLDNKQTQGNITIKQTMSFTGIITENNGDEITVSFATEGVFGTMQMLITGDGADSVRELMKQSMMGEDTSVEEQRVYSDLINGKAVTIMYGTSLWDSMVDMQESATYLLDSDAMTFTEIEK